ncbi:MAG: SUMF1/EgtB/PvdO family nonheme iron enzyme [Snowella sp.]|nr:SUMF1/EgtB/PvdO family nonheme iron enzyme [Snowella sp.]
MTNQEPLPDGVVLSGQTQDSLDTAVLGGIEVVQQKLTSDNKAVKKQGILQALNYGGHGIEALFGILERERNLEIQWLAYQTLEKIGDPTIQRRLRNYFDWYEYESVTVNRQGEIIKRIPGRAKYYREDLGNGVYLDMVYIAGGSFWMGAPESEQKSCKDERPQHLVTVPDFWIGKYQVTQAQWMAIKEMNLVGFEGANRPVEGLSWKRCQEFCRQLSERTGKQPGTRYRLPSEAEWEYACRAGTKTPFSCGETITTKLANYNGNYTCAEERKGEYRAKSVECGIFPPNPWGIYDMHGNGWEWCKDHWHDSYQGAPTDGSIWNNNHFQTNYRVLKGGSWRSVPTDCRSARRSRSDRNYNGYGFRCVLVSGRI